MVINLYNSIQIEIQIGIENAGGEDEVKSKKEKGCGEL